MGGLAAKGEKVHPYPVELEEYQKNKANPSANENDLHNKHRKPTDVCCLTVLATFLTVLCCFIGYCVYYGDIGRVIRGYDNCGTVCGDTRRTKALEGCYGTTDEKNFGSYHLVVYKPKASILYDRICTNNCSHFPGYKTFLNRCIPSDKKTVIDKFFTKTGLKDFFIEVSEDFGIYWLTLLHMALISLVISLSALLLFRFIAKLMVWCILIGVVLVCLAATIYSWVSWSELKHFQRLDSEISNREVRSYLALAIALTIITIIAVLVIAVMIKRIKLVIQLFHEAGEAIAAMPHLLFEPILTFLSLTAIISLWIYSCLWISSAGYLTEKRTNVYYYRKNGFMEVTAALNFVGMLWTVQFVIGCQHMVVAGAVSKWYFTREKSQLSNPLTESFYNLTMYHLGTVATGSLLLVIVQVLRTIVARLQKENSFSKALKACLCCCECCLSFLERGLSMLNRNAYIITAMYGYSFCKAGKLAFTHLISNPLRVAAINSVGDFVLFLSKVLVVACTVGIASYFLKRKEGIQYVWVPLVLVGLFSYFISHCFITVCEMTIDTIFICFCEDCELNDGVSKPFYMSRGLMEFVENSKRSDDTRTSDDAANELNTVSLYDYNGVMGEFTSSNCLLICLL